MKAIENACLQLCGEIRTDGLCWKSSIHSLRSERDLLSKEKRKKIN